MTEQSNIQILQMLAGQVLALDPDDKDAIVDIGGQTEKLLNNLAAAPDNITKLLENSLLLLQRIHQDQQDNPAVAVGAISQALEAVRQWLAHDNGGDEPVTIDQATNGLQAATDGCHSSVADVSSAQTNQNANTCEGKSPSPLAEETSATPQIQFFQGPAILPEDTDPDILREFIIECMDHVTRGEACLLNIESNPEDSEQINTIFRSFHTIKGTSGFLGLDRIQKLAHLAENMLDRARNGEILLTGGYADLALKSCDTLRTLIESLNDAKCGQELPVPENLDALLVELSNPEKAGVGAESQVKPMKLGEILTGQGKVTTDVVEQAVETQGETPIGQTLMQMGSVLATDVVSALRVQKQQAANTAGQTAGDNTIRVGTARLDSLINIVGELVIAQSMVWQDPAVAGGASPRLVRNVSHAGKIIRELQDLTMSLRMVPLKATFQKMARLVRDLARKAGKQVHFVTEGDDTEIDRNMVEVLNDPLVHMIRNAVDHGVEDGQARSAKGKDATGTVTLRAYHSAGNVVIELCDDGNGLNQEKILAKAVQRGIIPQGRTLIESEIFNLIFEPGFSTADKITDVSGRGVGMDVVKKGIDSLRGKIETASTPGAGTTFKLRLPLTMAITDGMLLSVGKECYLLPTVSIKQSFRPEAGSISTVANRGEMVMLRGELLPLFRLHKLFNVSGAVQDAYQGLLIVIEDGGRRCALMVDELLGQHQVVIKSLGAAIGQISGVAGGAIMGDGRVGLILDAAGLLRITLEANAQPQAA